MSYIKVMIMSCWLWNI